jgi:putative RecB family exonuclease
MASTPVYLGEKPDGVSPSRVSQFITCPRQYQYVSVERLPEKKGVDAYRGTIFHAVLEAVFRDQPQENRTLDVTLQTFREMYPTFMTPDVVEELGFDEIAVQKYAAEITKLIRTYHEMEDAPSINLVGTERRLDWDMGGWGLRGIIDRFDRETDGSLGIVDYKTGKVPQGQYRSKALQPSQVYAYLAEKVLGERPSRIRLLYVKTGAVIEKAVTQADIVAAEKRVTAVWAAIEKAYATSHFPAQPSVLCGWCSFQQRCNEDNYSVF